MTERTLDKILFLNIWEVKRVHFSCESVTICVQYWGRSAYIIM